MHGRVATVLASLLIAACRHAAAPSVADSTAAAARVDDSAIALHTRLAPAFADTARQTLAALLKNPKSARFDSLIVVQPPKADGHWPSPVVCGRIGGTPGIGGRSAMTPFIYQNRINVFLLDQRNATAFAVLRAKECDDPAGRLLLK
jgi:hypothetical protein